MIKWIKIRKEEIEVSLFADNMRVYVSDPKSSTKKLLQMTNTFSKDTEHKTNSKEKISSLPKINDRGTKKEIKKTKPFITS